MGKKSKTVKANTQSHSGNRGQSQQSSGVSASINPSHDIGVVTSFSSSAPVQLMKLDVDTAQEYLGGNVGAVPADTRLESSGGSPAVMSRSSQGPGNQSEYHRTFTRARANSAIAHAAPPGSDEAIRHGHAAYLAYRAEVTDRSVAAGNHGGLDPAHQVPLDAARSDRDRHLPAHEAFQEQEAVAAALQAQQRAEEERQRRKAEAARKREEEKAASDRQYHEEEAAEAERAEHVRNLNSLGRKAKKAYMLKHELTEASLKDPMEEEMADSSDNESGSSAKKEKKVRVRGKRRQSRRQTRGQSQKRAVQEQAEQERLAQERAAQEQAEQERLAQERAAREQAEQERLAQERAAREQAEQQRRARERAAQERMRQERAGQRRGQRAENRYRQKQLKPPNKGKRPR
ncbi:MAG: hypothetical protein NE330_00790 [Lentisphaeraceae bacterium]|nr:hypothetical protein [Lentisphaeraceae bacterium]